MSPAATMDEATARTAVLRAADRVFYEQGVAGAGMVEVRDDAGVSLRRLYSLFPSKGDLLAAWLEDRHRTWMAWFLGAVDRRAARGAEPLLAAFDAIAEWARTPGYRGCAFLNTAAEATVIDERHRAIIASHKRELIAELTRFARAGDYRRPGSLGEAVGVLLDGAIVQAAVLGSTRPVTAARRAAMVLLETHR
jgi:AcrR family transcriptional regulator